MKFCFKGFFESIFWSILIYISFFIREFNYYSNTLQITTYWMWKYLKAIKHNISRIYNLMLLYKRDTEEYRNFCWPFHLRKEGVAKDPTLNGNRVLFNIIYIIISTGYPHKETSVCLFYARLLSIIWNKGIFQNTCGEITDIKVIIIIVYQKALIWTFHTCFLTIK